MTRESPQFNLRLPHELKEKVKSRAKANGRSLNSELVQIVQDAMAQPSPVAGYRDEAEKLADQCSQEIRDIVFDKLTDFYRNGGAK